MPRQPKPQFLVVISAFTLLVFSASAGSVRALQSGDPYADNVVAFSPGSPASEPFGDPASALGAPDFNEAAMRGWVTLGVGGSITLEFVDNVVINGPGPDLKIHADPAGDERIEVELSVDGVDYLSLGLLSEGEAINLAEVGMSEVRFVRLTDSGTGGAGVSPGAEIDALEALNSQPAGPPADAPGAATSVTGKLTWVRTGGPLGGLGYDVRMRPDDVSRMWVTDAFAGVHLSTDRGLTWAPSNQGIQTRGGESGDAIPVFSLTVDPNDHDILWAGTQNQRGIFKSLDGGLSWTQMDRGVAEREGITFRGFTIEPGNSDVVYAAGELSSWVWAGRERQGREFDMTAGVVYKTTDGGANWKAVWRGENLARYVWVNPQDVRVLYISTGIFDREAANSDPEARIAGGEGVLKSTDGGATWTHANNGLGNLYVGSLFMHPDDHDVLIAGAGNNQYYEGSGIYLTTDGGESWTQRRGDVVITAVEFAASEPDIAYAAGPSMVFRSSDAGRTWQRMTQDPEQDGWGPPGVRAGFPIDIQVDPDDADRLFANQYGGGNLLSEDGGRTWVVASTGYTGAQVRGLAVDPTQPGRVFAAARSGIFASYDGGDEWLGLNFPPSRVMEWNAVAIDPSDSQHVLAANNWQNDVLQSTDGGLSWIPTGATLEGGRAGWRVIAFAPSDPDIVYAGSAGFYSAGGFGLKRPAFGIRRSDDGGQSWTPVNTDLTESAHIAGLAVAYEDPMWVVAAAAGQGILRTTDGGGEWEQVLTHARGLPALSVAVQPQGNELLLASFDRGGLYRSADGGETWKAAAAGMPPETSVTGIAFDPTDIDIVYAGTANSGVYRSEDGGLTWEAIVDALRVRAVNAIALSADGQHLYAATEGEGVFRLDLNGQPPAVSSTPEVADAEPPQRPAPTQQAVATASADEDEGGGAGGLPCVGAGLVPLALLSLPRLLTPRRARRP